MEGKKSEFQPQIGNVTFKQGISLVMETESHFPDGGYVTSRVVVEGVADGVTPDQLNDLMRGAFRAISNSGSTPELRTETLQ